MDRAAQRKRRAFTLVELLTVIAIIALLIGILVPALNVVRDRAKDTKTKGLIAGIEKGTEMFNGEFGRYPRSRGSNPFLVEPGQEPFLTGAQWAVLQLVGFDLRGYVDPEKQRDTDGDGKVESDPDEWVKWYEYDPNDPDKVYPRVGPYVSPESGIVQNFESWSEDHRDMQIDSGSDLLMGNASSPWRNARIPFFVDPFGYPVLFYTANSYAKTPFSVGTGNRLNPGRYDQSDNAGFTGCEGGDGYNSRAQKGLNPEGDATDLYDTGIFHPLGLLGYIDGQLDTTRDKTFAQEVMDPTIYDSTGGANRQGRVWPYNPDSFLIIAAGKDGLWGTKDDIRNFGASD